jgi:hypothetical protein
VSEITDRVVRDLDDNERLLWIDFGKARRSRRTLEVPALLRAYLLALAGLVMPMTDKLGCSGDRGKAGNM